MKLQHYLLFLAFDDEEQSRFRLLRKQLSEMEKTDRASMATGASTTSGYSLNVASTSATGAGGSRSYGAHGHATQADVLSSSSAKINLMVERKRKMSAESCKSLF
jgi:hypothetical protein